MGFHHKATQHRSKSDRRDIYADVTDRIVTALEDGVAPWVRPWRSTGSFRNATTERPYHGVNTLLLCVETLRHGYDDPRWLTYKQARKLGGHVRKGEHGTRIVFWKFLERAERDPETGQTELRRVPMARAYTVFCVEQTKDGDRRHVVGWQGETFRSIRAAWLWARMDGRYEYKPGATLSERALVVVV